MNPLDLKAGDDVLFCLHVDVAEDHIRLPRSCHWHYITGDKPAEVIKSSDKTVLLVRYIVLCESCHRERHADPMAAVGQDAKWIGEPPDIERIQ